ncbi:hypothetical protein UFOVP830_50 [uncultured Caudovirales phage]|uniref:Uncharacterized protein n=1 Tax=uncultured Caudovirales phage TaxID=2100421 RepID=A0A6J5P0E6_9CAUD|nr:hypothetical protein UFOVP830_50 [uncultured Caudovirales phage]
MSQQDIYKKIQQFFNSQRYNEIADMFATSEENAAEACACEGVNRFANTITERSDFFVERCLGTFEAYLDENRDQLNAQEKAFFRSLNLI